MSVATELQTWVFQTLSHETTGLQVPVWDNVPINPDTGETQSGWPFVTIGDDTLIPWDTDEDPGWEATLTLHIWSRYPGRKEIKDLYGEIFTRLNRKAVQLNTHYMVDCTHDFFETFEDQDGITRHGVARFRVVLHEGGNNE